MRGVDLYLDPTTGQRHALRDYGTGEPFAPAGPELRFAAERLASLLAAFDVARDPGARVPSRLREAILIAYRLTYGLSPAEFWVEKLLGRIEAALVQQLEGSPTETPVAMLAAVREGMAAIVPGVDVPAWLSAPVVGWLLGHASIGGGGGRSRKMTLPTLRGLLSRGRRAVAAEIERDARRAGAAVPLRVRELVRELRRS